MRTYRSLTALTVKRNDLNLIFRVTLLNMEKECPANSQSTQIDLPYSSIDLQKNQ